MDDFRVDGSVDGSVVGYDVAAVAVLDEGDYDIRLPFSVDEKYEVSEISLGTIGRQKFCVTL